MASVRRRGDAWYAEVRLQGQVIRRTFDDQASADAWTAREEARIRRGETSPTPTTTGPGATVAQLMDRYSREVSPTKGGHRWEVIRLRKLSLDFPMVAAETDGGTFAEWRDRRLTVVSPLTVNRELNLISAVFTRAIKEWRLPMLANPVRMCQRPTQPPHRTRRVSDAERAAILKRLEWDGVSAPTRKRHWAAWTFVLALETMMRRGEIMRLTWEHVHLDKKFAHLPKTKNGKPRNVPLSSRARALIEMLPRRNNDARVVPMNEGTLEVYFRKAVKAEGIIDMHFHDSRREALTRISKKITNIAELARASGHSGTRSLMVYFAPDVTEMADQLD